MSYASPYINTSNTAIGLDVVIESIRSELEAIPWLSVSFGRAYEFKEKDTTGKTVKIPKCYTSSGEYINVFPNDTLFAKDVAASSFIKLKNSETYQQFNSTDGSKKKATLSVIFWGNLKLIDSTKDYIFTELLKYDVEKILKINQYVFELVEWVDERAEDVFEGYDLQIDNPTYLVYPFTGFRVDLTVFYDEAC